jgi:hypothetical protein
MYRLGLIERLPSTEELVDTRYLEQAVK